MHLPRRPPNAQLLRTVLRKISPTSSNAQNNAHVQQQGYTPKDVRQLSDTMCQILGVSSIESSSSSFMAVKEPSLEALGWNTQKIVAALVKGDEKRAKKQEEISKKMGEMDKLISNWKEEKKKAKQKGTSDMPF